MRRRPYTPAQRDYAEYLRSLHWKGVRAAFFASQRFKRVYHSGCARCGSRDRLELHHKTYARVGSEDLTDLEPLCHSCHGSHHRKERRRRMENPTDFKRYGTV